MRSYQKGRNSKYPAQIETWQLGELVPDWLSDVARIKGLDGSGNKILDLQKTNAGGYTLKAAGENIILVSAKTMNDYVCYGKNESGHYYMFTLTSSQFNLLYTGE